MANITVQQFQPSEIIAIFNDILAHQNNQASGKLVCIRGLYLKGNGIAYNGVYFDALRDENSQVELPIKITDSQRKELTPGNLVDILGTLGRRITPKSEIKLELNVSRVEVVKEQVIDENEVKRIEYRQRKVEAGFKNVDAILESLLFNNTRPQVALIIAASSITLGDFEDGIRAARATIDFHEERVTLTQTKALCEKLKELDVKGYHAIAIVRGGGIDSTTDVDKPEVIEVVSSLKTPFISGVGHKPEKIFLRQVADKWTPTPQGLGQYFSELAETVNEKKNKSQAALTEQIKKQFKDQLEAGQKQNKELQEKLSKLNKIQEEATKQHKEQLEAIQKQHKEQLEKTNKQNEELQKKLYFSSLGISPLIAVAEDEAILNDLFKDIPGDYAINRDVIHEIMSTGVSAPRFRRYRQAMIMAESEVESALKSGRAIEEHLLNSQHEINIMLEQ